MVIIKNYKVKKNYLTNFRKDWNKFSGGNFQTHNPTGDGIKIASMHCLGTVHIMWVRMSSFCIRDTAFRPSRINYSRHETYHSRRRHSEGDGGGG